MDIFSEIIISAVDKAKNAVVKIDKFSLIRGNERLSGSGSGFVFSSDGMILTNAHVIENSDRLNISLLDGNEFSGEMIGINAAIIPSAQGLSFSIGIDSVKEIARYLISDGKVMKAYLGLMTNEIEIHPRIKNFYRLSSKKGLLITGLESSSPASRANLHIGLVSPHTPFTLSPLQAELLYCPSSADMRLVRSH